MTTTTANSIVEFEQLTKIFPGVTALDQVTFEITDGEFHAICGENGAGKSTLMKTLAGVITDYEGTIKLDSTTVHFRGTRDGIYEQTPNI